MIQTRTSKTNFLSGLLNWETLTCKIKKRSLRWPNKTRTTILFLSTKCKALRESILKRGHKEKLKRARCPIRWCSLPETISKSTQIILYQLYKSCHHLKGSWHSCKSPYVYKYKTSPHFVSHRRRRPRRRQWIHPATAHLGRSWTTTLSFITTAHRASSKVGGTSKSLILLCSP